MAVADRRAQLLELGLAAFTSKPYDEVALDDIAAEAGISRGLLFHYFPTKRDFYVATLQLAADELLAAAFTSDEGTPLERLAKGLDAYFRYVERHARAYATLLRGGPGNDPAALALVEATRSAIIDRIAAELPTPSARERPRVRAALRGWIGFVESIALHWIDHRDVSRRALAELAVRAAAALFISDS